MKNVAFGTKCVDVFLWFSCLQTDDSQQQPTTTLFLQKLDSKRENVVCNQGWPALMSLQDLKNEFVENDMVQFFPSHVFFFLLFFAKDSTLMFFSALYWMCSHNLRWPFPPNWQFGKWGTWHSEEGHCKLLSGLWFCWSWCCLWNRKVLCTFLCGLLSITWTEETHWQSAQSLRTTCSSSSLNNTEQQCWQSATLFFDQNSFWVLLTLTKCPIIFSKTQLDICCLLLLIFKFVELETTQVCSVSHFSFLFFFVLFSCLQVDQLKRMCEVYLSATISFANSVPLLKLANRVDAEHLRKEVFVFVLDNPQFRNTLIQTLKWEDFLEKEFRDVVGGLCEEVLLQSHKKAAHYLSSASHNPPIPLQISEDESASPCLFWARTSQNTLSSFLGWKLEFLSLFFVLLQVCISSETKKISQKREHLEQKQITLLENRKEKRKWSDSFCYFGNFPLSLLLESVFEATKSHTISHLNKDRNQVLFLIFLMKMTRLNNENHQTNLFAKHTTPHTHTLSFCLFLQFSANEYFECFQERGPQPEEADKRSCYENCHDMRWSANKGNNILPFDLLGSSKVHQNTLFGKLPLFTLPNFVVFGTISVSHEFDLIRRRRNNWSSRWMAWVWAFKLGYLANWTNTSRSITNWGQFFSLSLFLFLLFCCFKFCLTVCQHLSRVISFFGGFIPKWNKPVTQQQQNQTTMWNYCKKQHHTSVQHTKKTKKKQKPKSGKNSGSSFLLFVTFFPNFASSSCEQSPNGLNILLWFTWGASDATATAARALAARTEFGASVTVVSRTVCQHHQTCVKHEHPISHLRNHFTWWNHVKSLCLLKLSE